MRAPGDILLVSCYELGRQPLALATAAAFLRRAGFAPATLDLAVEPLEDAALARARLIAISVPMHTALRLGVHVARRARAVSTAHVCFFGLYAPLNAAALDADSILGGESEEDLVALAERLAPTNAVTLRRLAFLRPERETLPPLERYAKLVIDGERRLAGAVEATRGCRHLCRHCPIPAVYHGRFFAVPLEVVVDDARQLVARGARHLTFADADFLNAPKHALAVARAVQQACPGVTFDVTIKVEHVLRHHEVFPELARLGCVFVVSAVESLSDRVLHLLDKGHKGADVAPALEIVRAAGISMRPTFLPFTPWTSASDYLELVHFIHAADLTGEVDPVQLSLRLLIPPGSLLLERPELAPHLGALDADAFTWRWTHPDPRMDALQLEVQALVEQAAGDDRPAAETFDAIHALAARALGVTRSPARPPRRRGATAHLSEPWFC